MGPPKTYGVGMLTESYVIYVERNASTGLLAAAGEVVVDGRTHGQTESQTIKI